MFTGPGKTDVGVSVSDNETLNDFFDGTRSDGRERRRSETGSSFGGGSKKVTMARGFYSRIIPEHVCYRISTAIV